MSEAREGLRLHPRWVYVATALALMSLPVSAWVASSAWRARDLSMRMLGDAAAKAARLRGLEVRMREAKAFSRQVQDVLEKAEATGMTAEGWKRRGMRIEKREMSRREVEGVLSAVGRDGGYLFSPEVFDLRVVQQGDGLFYFRAGDVDRLRLTLKGVYYIHRAIP